MFCGHSGPRAVGVLEEDARLLLVGCSSLRGCGGTSWSGGLGMRASNLEEDPSRLEPRGDADSTGLGDSWARGALTMRGSKVSEGSGEGRRPGDSCKHGPGESCWAGGEEPGVWNRPSCSWQPWYPWEAGCPESCSAWTGHPEGSRAGEEPQSTWHRRSCRCSVRPHRASSACKTWISFRRAWLCFSNDSCCWGRRGDVSIRTLQGAHCWRVGISAWNLLATLWHSSCPPIPHLQSWDLALCPLWVL